ncbi:hypothetical protein HWE05_31710 [Caballeronia zhejiangensis]|nr:hypothetical protein [Caballeronia zhejiangensis]
MNKDEKAATAGLVSGGATIGGIGWAAAGLSAAEITGTLATLGAGYGMAAGIAAVAAIPLLVGGLGYGAYKLLAD